MSHTGPGQSHRTGISLIELFAMFPDEEAATAWFESVHWPEQRCCGHCGSLDTKPTPHSRPMPYWCSDCRSYFSVRTGTVFAHSKVPLQKWAIAIYLYVTNLKSISSMHLHRDLGVTQKTAWFMLHRLREAWSVAGQQALADFEGPVEVDETYIGGLRKNMPLSKRIDLHGTGTGMVGKTPIVGIKDRKTKQIRAMVPESSLTRRAMVQYIGENVTAETTVYTDGSALYNNLPYEHDLVRHDWHEYVKGDCHTNGIESFWAPIKRAYKGTFHRLSVKHLHRYVVEFVGRHNVRGKDTIDQMRGIVEGSRGKRLTYRGLLGYG